MIKFLVLFGMLAYANAGAALSKAEMDVSNANNMLGFKMYKELAKTPGNVLFSPASAETILALTFTGARGSTANEMQAALSLPDAASTAAGYKAVTQNLKQSQNGVVYNSANKIYPANDVKVKPEFLKIAQDSFNADVQTLDFGNPTAAADTINQYVEAQTNNKIKNLISPDSLTSFTRMVLVNAVYFLGKWKHTFEKLPTNLKFHTSETESKEVPFMYSEETYGYAECDELDAQIVDIPYNNTDYSLRIILPRTVNGLAKVESQLPLNLEEQTKKLSQERVNLRMPKFKVEQTIPMVDHLKALGMNQAFNDGADFSGISNENLVISDVLQKAFIEVNEEGTEAAASTVVQFVSYSIVVGEKTMNVVADKPFIFYLHHKPTHVAIFVGRLVDPK